MTSPIIIHENQRVVVTSAGPQGQQGIPGGGSSFQHNQVTPSASWVISHNLGVYAAVTILIAGVPVGADVSHGSLNQTSIVFPTPQAGVAIFS